MLDGGKLYGYCEIDGVQHEFSSIEGVVEDVTSIVLNLKEVVLSIDNNDPNVEKRLEISVKGPHVVTAKDIKCDNEVTIVNEDQHIATVNKGEFHMVMVARKGIGYLPQESSIFKGLTVEENILSILEILNVTTNEKYEILEDLLAEFNINHIRNSYGATLSGGERRRVEIARALATNPSYILLDEPLAGIDPIAVNDVKNFSCFKKLRLFVKFVDPNINKNFRTSG